jgi:hypothetical protein
MKFIKNESLGKAFLRSPNTSQKQGWTVHLDLWQASLYEIQ